MEATRKKIEVVEKAVPPDDPKCNDLREELKYLRKKEEQLRERVHAAAGEG